MQRHCSERGELKILDLDVENVGRKMLGGRSSVSSCWTAVRIWKRCCGGAIQALVTGTTVVNGTLEPILEVTGGKAVFYGISIAGVAQMLGLERFCPRST
ncbi:MAG: hypothetical protein U9N61_03865 [Euryarchaeota archaeon]|nr:hypothetical protein [Euryarchaeota archaeon]